MAIKGITIIEGSISTATSATQGFTDIYMVITSAAATGLNTVTSVKDVIDFASKFPATIDAVLQSVKLIFTNNPSARLSIVSGSDVSNVTTGDSKTKADLLFGINVVVNLASSALAIVICPQRSQLAAQADRTTIFSAIESLCTGKRWLFFANTSFDCATKLAAVTERSLYSSPNGNSSLYYGYALDNDNKLVPLAAAAASLLLLRTRVESAYDPPGGAKYPIAGIQSIVGDITQQSDYDDMKASNINVVQTIPTAGYCFWLARTLSSDPKFMMINSRMAMSIVSLQLERSLIPTLIDSVDPNGSTRREVVRICQSIMQQAYLNSALSGATPEEAYKIVETVIPVGGDLKKIQIQIFARFVGTLEQIEIQLINVDVIPS